MSDATPLSSTPARGRSWLLIVSLALNLLVVGAVGGAIFSHRGHGGPWAGGAAKLFDQINFGKTIGGENGLRAYILTLPADRRAELKPILDDARQNVKPLRDRAQSLREAAHSAFTSEPFDGAKAEQAASDLFEAEASARRIIVQYFSKLLAAMTPEERAHYFSWRKTVGPPEPPPPPPGGGPK